MLAHEHEPVDVVDVVVELGDDDHGRIAERVEQALDARLVACGERGQLARRDADALGQVGAELLRERGRQPAVELAAPRARG